MPHFFNYIDLYTASDGESHRKTHLKPTTLRNIYALESRLAGHASYDYCPSDKVSVHIFVNCKQHFARNELLLLLAVHYGESACSQPSIILGENERSAISAVAM